MKKLIFLLLVLAANGLGAQTLTQKLDAILQSYAGNQKFNGEVLIAQKGRVLYQRALGWRDAEAGDSLQLNSIFQIGSVTKQFTSAVIMQLQEEGRLSVKDTLGKYFSGFANGGTITIEHLLTHTSGMYNYTKDKELMSDVTRHFPAEEMLGRFAAYKPDFEPGSSWSYSNSAYSVLGYIIEKVTGKKYEAVVRERIFGPLGMRNSGFDFTGLRHPKKAKGYFRLAGNKGLPAPVVDSSFAFSAGAIYSTAEDLLKWERALATGRLLKPASWQAVYTPFKNNYGYGWEIDTLYATRLVHHSGGIHGFTAHLVRFPEMELAVIIMDNSSSKSLFPIARMMAAAVMNQPYTLPKIREEVTLVQERLREYVGRYELNPSFIIRFYLENGMLFTQATGQPAFPVFAADNDILFLKVVDAELHFERDEKGKVSGVVLHQNGVKQLLKKIE